MIRNAEAHLTGLSAVGAAHAGRSVFPAAGASARRSLPDRYSASPAQLAWRAGDDVVAMLHGTPIDPSSAYRAIENLIATYAELVDDGEFDAVGRLLADATFAGSAGSVRGSDAIEQMLRENVIVHDDGTPRTKHVTTNLDEVDEGAGTALARSYFTVLQALPDFPLQLIVSGRYLDRFERRDGQWRFAARRVRTDLVGDVSRHLRGHGASA
jgi:3-phenylpropionate/cinnamic acid dioxygenase small subunit